MFDLQVCFVGEDNKKKPRSVAEADIRVELFRATRTSDAAGETTSESGGAEHALMAIPIDLPFSVRQRRRELAYCEFL